MKQQIKLTADLYSPTKPPTCHLLLTNYLVVTTCDIEVNIPIS